MSSPYHSPYSGSPPSHLAANKPLSPYKPITPYPSMSPRPPMTTSYRMTPSTSMMTPRPPAYGSPGVLPGTPPKPLPYGSPAGMVPRPPMHGSPVGMGPRPPMHGFPAGMVPRPPMHGSPMTNPGAYGLSPRPPTSPHMGAYPRPPMSPGAHASCTCPCGVPGSRPMQTGYPNQQLGFLNNVTGIVSTAMGTPRPPVHSQPGFFGGLFGGASESIVKQEDKNYKSDNIFTKNLYI